MNTYTHLAPSACGQIDLPATARIEAVLSAPLLVHERLACLLSRVDALVHQPPQDRVAGMAISVEVGSGKTVFARHLAKRYRIARAADYGIARSAAVEVNMSGARDAGTFFQRLLSQLPEPEDARGRRADLEGELAERFGRHGVRLLVVDDVHHIFHLQRKQRSSLLSALVALAARLRLPMILLTSPQGPTALQECRDLHARVTHEALPTWTTDAYLANLLAGLRHEGRVRFPSMHQRGLGIGSPCGANSLAWFFSGAPISKCRPTDASSDRRPQPGMPCAAPEVSLHVLELTRPWSINCPSKKDGRCRCLRLGTTRTTSLDQVAG